MIYEPSRTRQRATLLDRYCRQLRQLSGRRRTDSALLALRQQRELSDFAQTAMLEAESANRAKTEFLANISHELRTPLNAIIGFSDIMARGMLGPVDNEKYQEYARDITNSGSHLLELINGILDLAKIEAGKLELREEEISVEDVLSACLTIMKERAREGEIELTTELPGDLPHIVADELKVKQILINLMSNAVKFTLPGGCVVVRAGVEEDGVLGIAIADTGIGMSESDIQHAIDPFNQVDSRLARKFEGTGLGLPLAKRLIELHEGSLDIVSRPGSGTTAAIWFPPSRLVADDERKLSS